LGKVGEPNKYTYANASNYGHNNVPNFSPNRNPQKLEAVPYNDFNGLIIQFAGIFAPTAHVM